MSVRADRGNAAVGQGAVATPSNGGQPPAATSSASANGNTNNNTNGAIECLDPNQEERAGKVREVGSQAIWSLSSCKPGNYFIFFIYYTRGPNKMQPFLILIA